ncbi:MAG: tRNA threonylcarbamoyladenosine dehydratase [Bacteroidales bacterium]|nr:tRNA threonylcarbamoyladenosine dehydratase [Bacteroidales bacterium]
METLERDIFDRAALMLGGTAIEKFKNTKVIIFGIGGVGSWCAESLIRTGIGNLTIVDSDCVSISNVNRQLMATVETVGQVKVEALKTRLLALNPHANITAVQAVYSEENADSFNLASYDVIIDCIDSLKNKVHLILKATNLPKISDCCDESDANYAEAETSRSRISHRPRFYSSMGAALKIDPTKVRTAEFWDVKGCPLAAALRHRMRHAKTFPGCKFKCVYSDEVFNAPGSRSVLANVLADHAVAIEVLGSRKPSEKDSADTWASSKAQINGSLAHITAIFGFTLAGLVIKDLL